MNGRYEQEEGLKIFFYEKQLIYKAYTQKPAYLEHIWDWEKLLHLGLRKTVPFSQVFEFTRAPLISVYGISCIKKCKDLIDVPIDRCSNRQVLVYLFQHFNIPMIGRY